MSTAAIAKPEQQNGLVTAAARVRVLAESLTEETAERKLLMQYVQHHMVEGTDYGVIPGTQRKDKDGGNLPTPKTLLKPGAEKLTELFRCTPEYQQTRVIEDWDKPLFHYEFLCRIRDRASGTLLAEGVGSCNSREAKYRWRAGGRKCPECGAAAIMRSKFPPRDDPEAPPGWYCYAKKGGCGINFAADDQAITSQAEGRVENPDVFDSVNTILKMAKKRALVDATISLVRCSDMFTQDVEDFADDAPKPQPTPAPRSQPRQPTPESVDDARKRLTGCATLSALADVWKSLPGDVQTAVREDKDKRKADLTPAAAPTTPPPAADRDSMLGELFSAAAILKTTPARLLHYHAKQVGAFDDRKPMPTVEQLTDEQLRHLLTLDQQAADRAEAEQSR